MSRRLVPCVFTVCVTEYPEAHVDANFQKHWNSPKVWLDLVAVIDQLRLAKVSYELGNVGELPFGEGVNVLVRVESMSVAVPGIGSAVYWAYQRARGAPAPRSGRAPWAQPDVVHPVCGRPGRNHRCQPAIEPQQIQRWQWPRRQAHQEWHWTGSHPVGPPGTSSLGVGTACHNKPAVRCSSRWPCSARRRMAPARQPHSRTRQST